MNRIADLRRALASLRAQNARFELVVVDNGSSDGTPQHVRATWPAAALIELPENVGIAAGRNLGIRAARGDVVVLLDDDAELVDPDGLARLQRRFARDPALGIVASHSVLAATGECERDAIPRRDKRALAGDFEASYFCGVAAGLRTAMLERTGLFSEDFRYGCEELDLSWRALVDGWRIVRAADFTVRHHRSPRARPAGRWVRANARNRVRVALRHLPWPCVVSYAAIWMPWLVVRAARERVLSELAGGVAELVRLVPSTLRLRRPLPRHVLTRIARLDGRLLY